MFIHEDSTRESTARVVEQLKTCAKRNPFLGVDGTLLFDIDASDGCKVALNRWGLAECELQEVRSSPSRVPSRGVAISRAIVAAELSTNPSFKASLLRLHETCLEQIEERCPDVLQRVAETSSRIRSLGLQSLLNKVSYTALRKHLSLMSQEIIEGPGQSILEEVHAYMENTLDKYFAITGLDRSDWLRQLGSPVFEVVQEQRINSLFDLVTDYPESLPALDDLKQCITQTREYGLLISTFSAAIQSRLLHPGACTLDIIKHYMSTIKVLKYIDPSGYILDVVSKPIQHYLRSRRDTIRNIVILLTDDNGDDSFLLSSTEVTPSPFYGDEESAKKGITDWHPAPLEIAPINAPQHQTSQDTISLLTNIYGTKELFLSAYRSMLADKLIRKIDFDCSKEVKTLELLKVRFGDSALHSAEIMMRDVHDSKRLHTTVQKEFDDSECGIPMKALRVLVTSDQYWPSYGESDLDFALPGSIQDTIEVFGKRYHHQKAPRKLIWKKSLGEVSLELKIGDQIEHFNVTPVQATVILQFASTDTLSVEELCNRLRISESHLMPNIVYWVNEGVVSMDESRLLRRNEAIIRPVTTIDIENQDGADENESSMNYLEPFIVGMLTNFDVLPLERIHNMLKMFVTDPPYDRSLEDLGKFMNVLLQREKIALEGNNYKIYQ